jgi:Uma2 family endonuclease
MQVATDTQATEAPAEPSVPLEVQVMEQASPRLFTVDEFHRMLEAGVFGEEERLELLEGVIVALTSQNAPHASAIQRLTKWFVKQLDDAYALMPQLPVTLGKRTEPVPDLAVVRAEDIDRKTLPRTALLVIEVADSSLRKDRGVKTTIYARYGIPEYWIVNVKNSTVEVHRDPDPEAGRYRTLLTAGPDATLSPTGLPGVSISLRELFA